MKAMGLLLISVIYKIIKIFKIKGDIKMKYLYEEYVQKNDKHGWWTTFFIDEDTGVEYVKIGDSICPRYNADGSLFVQK